MKKLKEMMRDTRGDMAEKAVVWVLILLAAMGAFALLGGRIAEAVQRVANAI